MATPIGGGDALPRRPQLSEEIATRIRDMIMSGTLRPGEFIRLDAIAQQLGTSVTPVREALMLLRGEDMVRQLPRRGYVVSPLSRRDVEDLFAVQAQLAGELVARATGRIDAAGRRALGAADERLTSAAKEGRTGEVERLEYEFHRIINLAADSPKLAHLLRNASQYIPQRFYSEDPGWLVRVGRDHHDILVALRAGSPEQARTAMRAHVLDGAQRLVTHLTDVGFWAG